MEKRVACVFTTVPYGSVIAQEGLDVSLALSMSSDMVDVFLIADGIFLIFSNQKFQKIEEKKIISSNLEILSFCGIEDIYLCSDSAFDRGITNDQVNISFNIIWLSSRDWRKRLSYYNLMLSF